MNPVYMPIALLGVACAAVLACIVFERIYCRACKRLDAWFEIRYFTTDTGVEHISEVMVCKHCEHVRVLKCEPI